MVKANAVSTQVETLTPDELQALIAQSGYAPKPSQSIPRIKFSSGNFILPNGDQYVYNPRKPDEPAITLRILKPLDEYFAYWIDDDLANQLGRKDLANTFSKSYLKEDPDRMVWDSDLAYDFIREKIREDGILDNYGKPLKAKWTGDLLVHIMPDDGEFKGDEVPHILTLSVTSVMEFRGSSQDRDKGSATDKNFIRKMTEFAVAQAAEAGVTSKEGLAKAVTDAFTSYSLGGVVADVRSQLVTSPDNKNIQWHVAIFDPVYIQPIGQDPVLTAGNDADQHDEDPGL